MSVFSIEAYVNVHETGAYFIRGYSPSDPLKHVPGLFHVEADDVTQAAEKMFEIGNIGTPDRDGNKWPHHSTRSLSVGDVLVVTNNEVSKTLACAKTGWREV